MGKNWAGLLPWKKSFPEIAPASHVSVLLFLPHTDAPPAEEPVKVKTIHEAAASGDKAAVDECIRNGKGGGAG